MKTFRFNLYLMLLVVLAGLQSCNITRNVPDGSYLLASDKIEVDNPNIELDELITILKQKPNRSLTPLDNTKFRYIRFSLGMYNFCTKGKERKWKNWLKEAIGEEPVLLDTNLTNRSSTQMKLYLHKKGFFHAQVIDTTYYHKKRATVIYTVKSSKPYHLNTIGYDIEDTLIERYVFKDAHHSLLKKSQIYDEAIIELERDRITTFLRNTGYYKFSKEYISFSADSSVGNEHINIMINILDPDTSIISSGKHEQYYQKNIYVYPNTEAHLNEITYKDTINHHEQFYIVFNKEKKFKPNTLARPIFFEKGKLFNQQNIEDTYIGFSMLRSFKLININFLDYKLKNDTNYVDAYIKLSPIKKRSFSYSADGTNSSGNIGLSGAANYTDINTFGGAELMELSLKGTILRLQNSNNTYFVESQRVLPNAFIIGPEFSLQFPRFVFPFINTTFAKKADPRTFIKASVKYQNRPEYSGIFAKASFEYTWKQGSKILHNIAPAELNFQNGSLDPSYQTILKNNGDFLTLQRYANLSIPSGRYSFTYNDQSERVNKSYTFFNANFEFAGNLIRTMNEVFGSEKFPNENDPDSSYHYKLFPNQSFKQQYSQYTRIDLDYRHYFRFSGFRKIVFRAFAGAGFAYFNSDVMPFQRSFMAGGANDIRAWRAYSLGPGKVAINSKNVTQRVGDVKLETNLEYRYRVYKLLHAATFLDIGNIWLLAQDSVSNLQGGQINKNTVLSGLAIGTGFGIRWDFTFFILRLDAGLKLRDPARGGDDVWVIGHVFDRTWRSQYDNFYNEKYRFVNINLGLGYPF